MNIYVEGDKETHQRWIAAASLQGMTLAQWVAESVRIYRQTELAAVEQLPIVPRRKRKRKEKNLSTS